LHCLRRRCCIIVAHTHHPVLSNENSQIYKFEEKGKFILAGFICFFLNGALPQWNIYYRKYILSKRKFFDKNFSINFQHEQKIPIFFSFFFFRLKKEKN